MRLTSLVLAIAALAIGVAAQTTPAPAPTNPFANTFNLTVTPIVLPGNQQTVAGAMIGGTFNLTPNVALRETNLLAPGNNFSGYYGGVNYNIPKLANAINNASTTINGFNLMPYVTASAGVGRVTPSSGPTQSHYSAMGGAGLAYAPAGSKTFQLSLIEVQGLRAPGLHSGWTVVVSSGVKLSF